MSGGAAWNIVLSPTAQSQLAKIKDRRVREVLGRRIDELAHDPELQGKPLTDELTGFRSVRAVGQRYRILYKVAGSTVTVYVITIGLRKEGDKADVYVLAKKLLRLGLLEPDSSS